MKATMYIAIDGMGGSGKTYLSERLAKVLGATLYHLDEYGDDYKPFIGLPKLREIVAEATGGVVIYEGVGVFDESFDDLQPFRIFVQVPDIIRHERATGRDVPRDGRTAEEWDEIWQIWNEAEAAYFTNELRQKADMVVGTGDRMFDIDAIVSRLAQMN